MSFPYSNRSRSAKGHVAVEKPAFLYGGDDLKGVNSYSNGIGNSDALVENTNQTMAPGTVTQYRVEHLASFQHENGNEEMSPADAMKKLNEISEDGGLWSQLMKMQITDDSLIMRNWETTEVIEEYGLDNISLSTFVANHPVLNNIFIFSTRYSTDKVGAIHLFQCRASEAERITADINQRKVQKGNMTGAIVNGGFVEAESPKINGHTNGSKDSDETDNIARKNRENMGYQHDEAEPSSPRRGSGVHQRVEEFKKIAVVSKQPVEVVRTGSNVSKETRQARINRDVEALNRCIEAAEEFIIELKKMNDARKKLSVKGPKKSMKRKYENTRSLAKGPNEDSAIDMYKKFKYAFNLLGKLKAHINNPNAPELTIYLFVPLEIIVKVLGHEGARNVVSPLLTVAAIDLLTNCLPSRYHEFWKSLGPNWSLPQSAPMFHDKYVTPYIPKFKDGWTPPEIVADERGAAAAKSTAAMVARMKIVEEEEEQKKKVLDEKKSVEVKYHYDVPPSQPVPAHTPPEKKPEEIPVRAAPVDLKYAMVVYDYWAHNNKELTIRAGEKVVILDDTRRWWLVRNDSKEQGYVPSTVLEIYNPETSSEASSAGSSTSPTASPSGTAALSLSTAIEQSKHDKSFSVETNSPTRVTAKSIITESSQFSNPSSPVTETPPELIVAASPQVVAASPQVVAPSPQVVAASPQVVAASPQVVAASSQVVAVSSEVVSTSSQVIVVENNKQEDNGPPTFVPPQPPVPVITPPSPVIVKTTKTESVRKEVKQESFHDELSAKLQTTNPGAQTLVTAADSVDFFIPLFKSSTADDVSRWLKRMKFDPLTVERMSGTAAKELFKIPEDDLIEMLGESEGKRLYNELQVQTGAVTRHKTMTEFQKALLERMKRQDTIQKNVTKHQVVVKSSSSSAAVSQEEMQKKFKEQQALMKAQHTKSNPEREPEKPTFSSFQGEKQLNNNEDAAPAQSS